MNLLCAHCNTRRERTSGAPIVGGIHICYQATIDWMNLSPNAIDAGVASIMRYDELQRTGDKRFT